MQNSCYHGNRLENLKKNHLKSTTGRISNNRTDVVVGWPSYKIDIFVLIRQKLPPVGVAHFSLYVYSNIFKKSSCSTRWTQSGKSFCHIISLYFKHHIWLCNSSEWSRAIMALLFKKKWYISRIFSEKTKPVTNHFFHLFF